MTAVLEKNRDNIAKSLPGLAQYELTTGELVSSGPYYQAMIANLGIPELLQPFLDYAFGFRRGANAGQPPDNAGPREEVPFPVNGIPRPGDGGANDRPHPTRPCHRHRIGRFDQRRNVFHRA